jgi:hypothetical protein
MLCRSFEIVVVALVKVETEDAECQGLQPKEFEQHKHERNEEKTKSVGGMLINVEWVTVQACVLV